MDNVHVPSSSNVDVIRRLNAAFNAGDVDAFQSLLSPDVEFTDRCRYQTWRTRPLVSMR